MKYESTALLTEACSGATKRLRRPALQNIFSTIALRELDHPRLIGRCAELEKLGEQRSRRSFRNLVI
jgi:hypothetical protein